MVVSDDTHARVAIRETLLVPEIRPLTLPAKQNAPDLLPASRVLVPVLALRGIITRLVFTCLRTSCNLPCRPTDSSELLKNVSASTTMMTMSVVA